MGALPILLLILLGALLAVAALGDWRSRTIPNWLNAAIAGTAPAWWFASTIPLWPGVAIQAGIALGAFALFALFFALGAMGGGDVKLISALGLWFPVTPFLQLLTTMALVGGALTIAMVVGHRLNGRQGQPEIPYGIAIAGAGLWTIFRTIS